MGLYLRDKFQVSSMIETSFRQVGGGYPTPTSKQTPKNPAQINVKKRCFENMQQIYGRTPMSKCDFGLRHGCSPVNLL